MSVCCSRIRVDPLFKYIKKGDFMKPFVKMRLLFPNVDYFQRILDKGVIDDDVFLKYLMCRPNMRIYIFNKKQNDLEKYKGIQYYKMFKLSDKKYHNLMLQLKSISKYFNKINTKHHQRIHHIHVFFTEQNIDKQFQLRSDPNLIHQTKHFLETIINAKTILNPMSMKYLEYQDFNRIMKFKQSIKTLNKFMVWYYKNLSLLEMELLIIQSGFVSFTFGVRQFTDFDIILCEHKFKKNMIKKLTKYMKINDKIDIADYNYTKKNTHKYLIKLIRDGSKLSGGKTEYDCFYMPKLYYYFYGIKVYNLKTHLFIRFVRGRPANIAELIAFNKILNIKVPIYIPDFMYHKEYVLTKHTSITTPLDIKYFKKYIIDAGLVNESDIIITKEQNNRQKLLKTVLYYLTNKYYLKPIKEDIEKYFKNKIDNFTQFRDIMNKNKI